MSPPRRFIPRVSPLGARGASTLAHAARAPSSLPAALQSRRPDPDGRASISEIYLSIGCQDADPQQAVVKPSIQRSLPERATGAGLEVSDFLPGVLAKAGRMYLFFINAYIPAALAQGDLPEKDGRDRLDRQAAASGAGAFFGSCNYYTYLLGKPG